MFRQLIGLPIRRGRFAGHPRRFRRPRCLPSVAIRLTGRNTEVPEMIIQSPYDDVELAPVPVHAFVLDGAAVRSGRPAIIDGPTGRALTYAELAGSVRRAAAGLVARGVAHGDVLALCSPNCPEFAVAYYAGLAAGALVTTVNPLALAGDIARQLTHSGARWLVTTAALAQGSAGEAAAAAGVRETFALGTATGVGQAIPFAALTGTGHPDRLPAVGPDDDAVLLYSSGTTGLPKGVLLSHRNLVANLCQMRTVHRVGPDDVVLNALPLYHVFALQVTLSLGLAAGATVVTMPRFDLEGFCGLVQEHGVTRAEVVPPIVLALARHPAVPGYDLSSLRLITSGAAPLGAALAAECAQRLGCRVKQAYGMTELGATHVVPDTGGPAESVGPLLPGAEARVVDRASGRDVGSGQRGEMLIRTPAAMRGYLGNPEATAATIDADSWLHTGDVVVADREGWFQVVDRVKELIKYKGSQVAPAALEAILTAHPAVADAAVIGRPDEQAGEIPTAVIVLRQPAADTGPVGRELMAYVAARVAPHEKIRRVEFVAEIPKSPSGKVLRRLLAGRDQAATPARPPALAGQPR
jgi:acyl-CoA synthetase (AMP-forming)/AMP-acid ligase II